MTFNFLDRGQPAFWRNSFILVSLQVSNVNVLRADLEELGQDIATIAWRQFASLKDEEAEGKHKLKLIMTYIAWNFFIYHFTQIHF